MKTVALAFIVACAAFTGCQDCNQIHNPVSKDYPCGTRAHPCSLSPLSCCWNTDVCGGPVGSGCPEGQCCFVGDDYGTLGTAPTDAAPVGSAKPTPQWKP